MSNDAKARDLALLEKAEATMSASDWSDLLYDYETSELDSNTRNDARELLALRLSLLESRIAALRSLNLFSVAEKVKNLK